jgi:hypothetical protein
VAIAGVLIAAQQPSNQAGMGIPTENLVDEPGTAPDAIAGTLHVAGNGCFHLRTDDGQLFVIWPEGFTQDAAVVVGSDGTRYAAGDALGGTGWVRTVDEVIDAADGPDGYLDMVLGYCAEGEPIAVLENLD